MPVSFLDPPASVVCDPNEQPYTLTAAATGYSGQIIYRWKILEGVGDLYRRVAGNEISFYPAGRRGNINADYTARVQVEAISSISSEVPSTSEVTIQVRYFINPDITDELRRLVAEAAAGISGLTQAQVDARIRPFAQVATTLANLDALGVADVAVDHIYVNDNGTVKKMSMGAARAFFQEALNFTNLDDAPAFNGQGGKTLGLNTAATALEFRDTPPITWDDLPVRLRENIAALSEHDHDFEEAVVDSLWTTDAVVPPSSSYFAANTWVAVTSDHDFDLPGHEYYELTAYNVAGDESDHIFFRPGDIPLAGGATAGAAVSNIFYSHVLTFEGDEGSTRHRVYIGRNLQNKWFLAYSEAGTHRYAIDTHEFVRISNELSVLAADPNASAFSVNDIINVNGVLKYLNTSRVWTPVATGAQLPTTATAAEARAGDSTAVKSWTPERIRQADAEYRFENTTGLQVSSRNKVSNYFDVSPITPGALPRTIAEILALFSTFCQAGALTNDDTEHVQRVLNMLVGGDWVDSETLTTTNDPTAVPAIARGSRTTDWDAASLLAADYDLRIRQGIRIPNDRFAMRIPKAWLEENTLTRVAWAVGALANDEDDFSDIIRYPLSSDLLLASNATYNFYARNVATNKPAGAQYRPQIDVPAELDPDVEVPQIAAALPPKMTQAEAEAGSATAARTIDAATLEVAVESKVLDAAEEGNTTAWSLGKTGVWTGTAAQYAALTNDQKDAFNLFFQTGSGAAGAPTFYTSLAQLPSAASMQTGAKASVITATAAMEFVVNSAASGSREWICVSGTSDDIINQNINFPNLNFVLAAGSWDFRFRWFELSWGSPLSTGGWVFGNWTRFDAALIEGLTASTAGVPRTNATHFGLAQWYNITGNDAGNRARFLNLGKTVTNGILLSTSHADQDVFPVRIRGTS